MRNAALVGLIAFNLLAALALPGQTADSERSLFNQVKAKAEKGDPGAQLELGSLYANGTGVAPDPGKGFKWHRKAAEQGLARAQYQLGLDYANGDRESKAWLASVNRFDPLRSPLNPAVPVRS